jgi:AraC-like DNA-binding protein
MRRATEFLEAHLDGDISLRRVAEICDLSLSHFARAFKYTFRKPPYQWLLERRIEKARDLLLNSRLPLADIAIRCGLRTSLDLIDPSKGSAGSLRGNGAGHRSVAVVGKAVRGLQRARSVRNRRDTIRVRSLILDPL